MGKASDTGVLNHVVRGIGGDEVDLASYLGRVVLVVNVASKCGFTPQYAGLEALYQRFKGQGFVVLGFPANNFLWQEPGSDAEIAAFCSTRYQVTFPMFAKVSVRGRDMAPLYRSLTSIESGGPFAGSIKWNFTKFLLGRDGKVRARFGPRTKPESAEVIRAVESALAEPAAGAGS